MCLIVFSWACIWLLDARRCAFGFLAFFSFAGATFFLTLELALLLLRPKHTHRETDTREGENLSACGKKKSEEVQLYGREDDVRSVSGTLFRFVFPTTTPSRSSQAVREHVGGIELAFSKSKMSVGLNTWNPVGDDRSLTILTRADVTDPRERSRAAGTHVVKRRRPVGFWTPHTLLHAKYVNNSKFKRAGSWISTHDFC